MSDITIIMASYNKENYIAEALDSVFMQETDYDYHIIIADDCSTDRTLEIVNLYQERYPNKITLLTSEKNQKLYKNVLRAYGITKTNYFCVLDPDDYWVDKKKIQKALDFLEQNKDFTIYVTDTKMLFLDGTIKDFSKRNKIIDSKFEDFLENKATLGHTSGTIFRNVVFKNGIPEKMRNLVSESAEYSFRGDSFRNAIHLYYGKSHCVPESDSVYRVTDDGIWQGISGLEQEILNTNLFKDLWLYFDKKYPELLITSYRKAQKIKHDLFGKLPEVKNINKKYDLIEQLMHLQHFYDANQEVIKTNLSKKIKFKYKIMLALYAKLQKKLLKKGLI